MIIYVWKLRYYFAAELNSKTSNASRMSPYVIFVIVLTIAYIIYYGYNISKDLYGKKGQPETTVEEFDVSGMDNEEQPTPVRETGEGFSLGGIVEEPIQHPEQPQSPEEPTPVKESNRYSDLTEQMDEADVTCTGATEPDDLAVLMANHDQTLNLFRKNVIKQTREAF